MIPRLGLSIAAFVLAAPAPAAGQVAPLRLELASRDGATLVYEHEKRLEVTLPAEWGGRVATRTRIRLRQTIEGRPPGRVGYRSVLEDVEFEADPPVPSLPDLSNLRAVAFRHETDLRGRLLDLELPGRQGEAGQPLREMLENWLGQLGFTFLPVVPVRPGDSWIDSTRVSAAAALGLAADYELLEVRSTSLRGIAVERDGQVATLDVESSWELGTETSDEAASSPAAHGSGAQVVRFDPQRGVFLGSTGRTELEFLLSPPGEATRIPVATVGTHVTRLVSFTAPSAPPD